MALSIGFQVTLPVEFKKIKQGYYVCCPALHVSTQGKTKKEAKHNIVEVIQLFLLSCYERGTLNEALQELGWKARAGVSSLPAAGNGRRYSEVEVPLSLTAPRRTPAHCPA